MFYDNLLRICDEKGIKVTNLLKTLGMSTGNLSKWSRDGYVPRSATVKKMADYLEVSVDELLYEQSDNSSESASLSKQEQLLVDIYRACSAEDQLAIMNYCLTFKDEKGLQENVG